MFFYFVGLGGSSVSGSKSSVLRVVSCESSCVNQVCRVIVMMVVAMIMMMSKLNVGHIN